MASVPRTDSPHLILGGCTRPAMRTLEVLSPEDGGLLAEVGRAGPGDFEEAIRTAAACRRALAEEPAWRRKERLRALAEALRLRAAEAAEILAREAGKPLRYARGEVERAVTTLELSAEEAGRLDGRLQPLDGLPAGAGRLALERRVPRGLCAFITPFNFPLNLVCHKIGPAMAVGAPWILKPAEKTPLSALFLGELLQDCEPPAPEGAWSILPALPEDASALLRSEEVRVLSFTGSARVGWKLRREAAAPTVILELGGSGATILAEDWPLEDALDRCARAAFAYSGQVCISLQRLLVPETLREPVLAGLAERAASLRRGPVLDEATEIGPLIREPEAQRVCAWIEEAVARGARLHAGGGRDGAFVEPAVLERVPHDLPLWREEVFGPVVVVETWRDFDEALELAGEGPWGLQAGLLTRDWERIRRAWSRLECGQILAGDTCMFRVDSMPYGGTKRSGLGREGVRDAVRALTEARTLILPG